MNRYLLSLALLAATPTLARAQSPRTGELSLSGGVHASYPEVVSASLVIRTSVERFDGMRSGYAVLLEPGLNGGRLLMGRETAAGLGIWTSGIGVLRTWNSPAETIAGVTYLSLEQRLTIQWLTAGIGFGTRVSGGRTSGLYGSVNQPGVAYFMVTGVLGGHFEF